MQLFLASIHVRRHRVYQTDDGCVTPLDVVTESQKR